MFVVGKFVIEFCVEFCLDVLILYKIFIGNCLLLFILFFEFNAYIIG